MDKIENLWKIFGNINEWIRYSDTKAVALLGIQGVILGITFGSHTIFTELTLMQLLLAAAGIVSNVLSAFLAFMCLSPRLGHGRLVSPIYFKSIAGEFASAGEYEKFVESSFRNPSDISHHLSVQIFANAQIAQIKFRSVAWSVRFFAFALAMWTIVTLVLLYN